VEEPEGRFAKLLGKGGARVFSFLQERRDHVPVRVLAGEGVHVAVQGREHSHIATEGDSAQLLSGLTLVPLASGRATMKAAEIIEAVGVRKAALLLIGPVRRDYPYSNRPVRRKARSGLRF